MLKVCYLFLLMCLLKNSTAKTALPADSASRLYAELGINQTISPSAFEKALKEHDTAMVRI